MDKLPAPSELASVYSKLEACIPRNAWDATVSIGVVSDSATQHWGTGTLLQIGQQRFLVTAAHVTRAATDAGRMLAIGTGCGFVAMEGDIISTGEEGRDRTDVGIVRLSARSSEKLQHLRPLRLSDLYLGQECTDDFYAVFGFPAEWAEADKGRSSVKPLQFCTCLYEGKTSMLRNYEPLIHFVLGGNTEYARQADGAEGDFPQLNGISGCGVWNLGTGARTVAEITECNPKFVGIETSVYRSGRIIRATKAGAIQVLLTEVFPELKPVFDLWVPGAKKLLP